MTRVEPGRLLRFGCVLYGLCSRDEWLRRTAIFIAFEAVPRWARRGPYLWAARWLMDRWHGPNPPHHPNTT